MNMLVSDLQRELSYLRCILYYFIPHLSDKSDKFKWQILNQLERNVKLYSNEKERKKEKKKRRKQ